MLLCGVPSIPSELCRGEDLRAVVTTCGWLRHFWADTLVHEASGRSWARASELGETKGACGIARARGTAAAAVTDPAWRPL